MFFKMSPHTTTLFGYRFWFEINKSAAHALGVPVVWHHSLTLMNHFNKANTATFLMQTILSLDLLFS